MTRRLTPADDWPAVHAASRPRPVTEGRGPARLTVAVVVVVTQLRRKRGRRNSTFAVADRDCRIIKRLYLYRTFEVSKVTDSLY